MESNAEVQKDLTVDGNETVKGDADTQGNQHVGKDLTVDGTSDFKGDVTMESNAEVQKDLTVDGNETVKGDADTQGNQHVGKDLTVDGTSDLKGDVTMEGNASVAKDFSVSGNTNLKDTKIDGTLETTGNATFDADAEVKGNSTVDGNSTVKGDSDVQGNTTIGKDLHVVGTSTLDGDVTTGANVSVGKDLSVAGNATVAGDSSVGGNAEIGKDLHVVGTSALDGDVTMGSNASVAKDFTVGGTTTLNGNLVANGDAHFTKDAVVDGTLTVNDLKMHGDFHTDGSADIGKDLHVTGTTQLDGNVLMNSNAIVQQNLGVGGDADIKGDLYVHDHNYIDSQGINANGYQIRNVADGAVAPGSRDAVNGGQLYSTKQALTGEINKVGAGAAALAGLHPGEFDPDNKLDFAAGYGHYKDANAAALGVFYHPNEDTTINISSTMGNGDPMLSAGVTFKLGPSGTKTMSRTALTKQIKEDQKVIKAMADEMAAMKAQMSRVLNLLDMSKKAPFADVPAGHWAKDAVDTLHGNGAIKGYPDGQFHGDKPMTRYEYAQMLYEALQKGAHVDQATLKEYAPELSQVKANQK